MSAAAPSSSHSDVSTDEAGEVNRVELRGRVSGPPVEVELPSGDQLVTFRLVVPRSPAKRPARSERRAVTVDTIDCVAWTSSLRRRVIGAEGAEVDVTGALRRRFYRGPAGPASRYEVEVTSLKKCSG